MSFLLLFFFSFENSLCFVDVFYSYFFIFISIPTAYFLDSLDLLEFLVVNVDVVGYPNKWGSDILHLKGWRLILSISLPIDCFDFIINSANIWVEEDNGNTLKRDDCWNVLDRSVIPQTANIS